MDAAQPILVYFCLSAALLFAVATIRWATRRLKIAARARSRRKREAESIRRGYHIFSREYDVEGHIRDLPDRIRTMSPDGEMGLLKETESALRARLALLDARIAEWRDAIQWQTIDAKLDRLSDRDALTLLLDHSGSMRGDRSVQVAASILLFADAAERRGLRFEVLGFSTAGWRGGFARQAWKQAGAPPVPGRLSALHHVIHKGFDEVGLDQAAFRGILDENLLRENVDGEAIEWASRRLAGIEAERRILIVVSDGAPVDDSTLLENDDAFLWRHLQQAIAAVESTTVIRLGSVQLGDERESCYRNNERGGDGELVTPLVTLLGRLARAEKIGAA